MKNILLLLSFATLLVSCSKRVDPPAPVSYGLHAPTVSPDTPQPERSSPIQEEHIIVVQQGESLQSIAERFDIRQEEIATRNNLLPPYHVFPGQNLKLPGGLVPKLFIPKVPQKDPIPKSSAAATEKEGKEEEILPPQKPKRKKLSAAEREKHLEDQFLMLEEESSSAKSPAKKTSSDQETSLKKAEESAQTATPEDPSSLLPENEAAAAHVQEPKKPKKPTGKFLWPVKGEVIGHFSQEKGKMKNDGLNIAAPKDTPIVAVEEGIVVYEGNEMQGFGNLVLLKHPDGWMSAYGHCSKIFVKRGQRVQQGENIALVGDTGSVRSAQLHFQLRKKSRVVDPAQYLE